MRLHRTIRKAKRSYFFFRGYDPVLVVPLINRLLLHIIKLSKTMATVVDTSSRATEPSISTDSIPKLSAVPRAADSAPNPFTLGRSHADRRPLTNERSRTVSSASQRQSGEPRLTSLEAIPTTCLPRGGFYVSTTIGPVQVRLYMFYLGA